MMQRFRYIVSTLLLHLEMYTFQGLNHNQNEPHGLQPTLGTSVTS